MHRLFLDANVLFSAAYSVDSGLLRFWNLKNVTLCSSHYAVEEARINLNKTAQKLRLDRLARRLHLFDATPHKLPANVLLPEKDIPIMLAAMEAEATHLITGDLRHFGSYFGKQIEGILVLSPAAYLETQRRSRG